MIRIGERLSAESFGCRGGFVHWAVNRERMSTCVASRCVLLTDPGQDRVFGDFT